MATSAWLHRAFPDLAFEVIEAIEAAKAGCTIAQVRMRAAQTGPFVAFPPGGHPIAFPPTGAGVRGAAVPHLPAA